jgi:sec-independent protein translocase protein TatA
MGSFGPVHWLIIAIVLLLLFGGRGKISDLMGDFAKGINSFRRGLKESDDSPPRSIPQDRADDVNATNKDQTVGH